MDQTFACQFAFAYRSPMVSAGKPHGAIGSLHIAAPPLQAPRTDDIRRVAAGVPQRGIRPSRRGKSPETPITFILSPRGSRGICQFTRPLPLASYLARPTR